MTGKDASDSSDGRGVTPIQAGDWDFVTVRLRPKGAAGGLEEKRIGGTRGKYCISEQNNKLVDTR